MSIVKCLGPKYHEVKKIYLLMKFPWKSVIIDGLFADLKEINVNENDYVIIDSWKYVAALSDIFYDYETNKKRYHHLYFFLKTK